LNCGPDLIITSYAELPLTSMECSQVSAPRDDQAQLTSSMLIIYTF